MPPQNESVAKLSEETYLSIVCQMCLINEKLLVRIRAIHADSDGRYGAPKIFAILKQEGYTGSIDRVQRIMKQAGIRSNIVKKYKPASSSAPVEERENVLE